MIRHCITLVVFAGSALAQSRVDLLQRVAQHYASADSFEVKGTTSALLTGTSWKVEYSFDAQGIQPKLLPPELHATSMKDIESVSPLIRTRTDVHATDPFPAEAFSRAEVFGAYQRLDKRLLDAKKAGVDTVIVGGRTYTCEVIDASYDESPDFMPNTAVAHKRFWIEPTELVVLREQRSSEGLNWTADVTLFSFDQPVSKETVEVLQTMADEPKERLEWIGNPLPDLILQQLSAPSIRLTDFRGKPVLLDFWGSYCGPCKAATLHAQELAKRYRASGLTVITVTSDTPEVAKLWATHNGVQLPVILDHDQKLFKALFAFEVPITIFADEQGKIVHYWTAYEDPAAMDAILSAALDKHTPATAGLTHSQ